MEDIEKLGAKNDVKRTKLTAEMLEEVKKWYMEGNSLRKVAKLIEEKYKVRVSNDTVRRHLLNLLKLRTKKEVMTLKRGTYLDEQKIVELYVEKKLSLKQIAKLFNASASGIKWLLLKNGVKLRDRREGLKLRIGKYEKPPFNGSKEDRGYLIGITLGDLHVRKRNTKFTIEVNTTTTCESMAKLLVDVFKKHTDGVICYWDKKKGFKFCAYLDSSFEFLLEARKELEIIKNFDREEFLSFLAGFFDAEGSIVKRKRRKTIRYAIEITNTNKRILELIKERLSEFGVCANLYKSSSKGKVSLL